MTLRVTHRSLFQGNLANLQQNLSRVQNTQNRLSSGKILQQPSDSPSGTSAALTHRNAIKQGEQFLRNANDGIGWLTSADSSLTDSVNSVQRVRELLVQGNNGTMGEQEREAIASEIDSLRESIVSSANREYLGRPIFSGTANVERAYETDGTFNGNTTPIERNLRPGVASRVNVTGPEIYGPPGADLFQFLVDTADHLRTDPGQLQADLANVDTHLTRLKNSLSTVGARYNQVEMLRNKTDEDLQLSRNQLSEVEDIDLPATIVELQLQETAYQAALSATARSVQPSLLDFLR